MAPRLQRPQPALLALRALRGQIRDAELVCEAELAREPRIEPRLALVHVHGGVSDVEHAEVHDCHVEQQDLDVQLQLSAVDAAAGHAHAQRRCHHLLFDCLFDFEYFLTFEFSVILRFANLDFDFPEFDVAIQFARPPRQLKVADRFQNIAIISVIPNMVKAGYRG